MKIEQNPEFQPITITIETEAEAQAIWDAVLAFELGERYHSKINDETIRTISNFFSNKAQLLNA